MDQPIQKQLEAFFSQFKHQHYAKGELLIRADDPPPGIFFLINGIVKEYTISAKGEELVINIFKSNSFFPISWALTHKSNRYFYEAMTKVEVWRAPTHEVQSFLKSHNDILFDLVTRVFLGLDGLLARMTYLMGGSAYQRVVAELIIYAKRFGRSTYLVEIDLSEKDVAAQSGLTKETVSREIKKLKEKKLLTVEKSKIIITDLELLYLELEGD